MRVVHCCEGAEARPSFIFSTPPKMKCKRRTRAFSESIVPRKQVSEKRSNCKWKQVGTKWTAGKCEEDPKVSRKRQVR
ncbi:hypothetical protein M514_03930 [Trichuris suis]|uniref:Uncharacterized protein n=1 Tax=Trichuris suis TaxID=68888 RepID=A0A085N8W8_9BILA|nr:hypothetical protein M514_03930 [Trichuris suis]